MIFTSYYQGVIKGEPISISLYPPKGWKGKHLPLFTPSQELLNWWKNSAKDEQSEKHYEEVFLRSLEDRLIDIWCAKQKPENDITLLCYENEGFCHRHLVGEIIKQKIPFLWGGEVSKVSSLPLPSEVQRWVDQSGIPCKRVHEDLYEIKGEVYTVLGAIARLAEGNKARVRRDRKSILAGIVSEPWDKWFDRWYEEGKQQS